MMCKFHKAMKSVFMGVNCLCSYTISLTEKQRKTSYMEDSQMAALWPT